jgi:hypothetical protein
MRPTTLPSASTSKSLSGHWQNGRDALARLRVGEVITTSIFPRARSYSLGTVSLVIQAVRERYSATSAVILARSKSSVAPARGSDRWATNLSDGFEAFKWFEVQTSYPTSLGRFDVVESATSLQNYGSRNFLRDEVHAVPEMKVTSPQEGGHHSD